MVRVTLSAEADQELGKFWRQARGREVLRAWVIVWLSWGLPVAEVAARLGWSEETVRDWAARYRKEGVAGLRDAPRSGRPRKADDRVDAVLTEALADPEEPTDGAPGVVTTKRLRDLVAEKAGAVVCCSTVRRALHRLRYVWRRSRVVLVNAPADIVAACAPIREALAGMAVGTRVVVQDETHVQVFPVVRSMWMKRGQRRDTPATGQHSRCTLFGGLVMTLGTGVQLAIEDWIPLIQSRARGVEVIAWLEQMVSALGEGPILLIWDNASTHTCHLVKDWLAAHPQITVVPLPPYCPRGNPMEDIWGIMKGKLQGNRYWGKLGPLRQALEEWVAGVTPGDLERICAKRVRANFCGGA